ncbi:uncharacterized protein LOC127845397 [Dreissena polymorpha]|uniref:Uncharacterized protein n=1 Tax=Dreissena polymorpha TaxID=45954 RepID=A0A9D4IHR2_DREPO|nr:uncharacterized protein LOC127845397 [Dreissena polymorpha]KAH3775926.1 hypothetical protein DPMN_177336 [Dreissena polymorpha]
MGNNNSVPAEKEEPAISFLRQRFGNKGGNADKLLVTLIAEEFGDVSGSRSPRSVSEKAQNIARRLRRKLLSRNEEDAPTDHVQSSASCISYIDMETEANDIMDAPVTQKTTDKFLQLRRLHNQPMNEPFGAIVELCPKSQNVQNPKTETETQLKDDNDFSLNNSLIAKYDANQTVLISERESGTSNDDVKSVCTANEANEDRFLNEGISSDGTGIGDSVQCTSFAKVPDMCCDKEVVSNSECVHQKDIQENDKISDTEAACKEMHRRTEAKQYDAMVQIRQTSFKYKMYVDQMKATAVKGDVCDVASKSVSEEASMSDMNVICKVQLPKNNVVFSSNMVGPRKNDTPRVTETCSSLTNEGNAVETPRSQLEAFKVVPEKKYGGIEHMMQIKLENDIRMKRMKMITANRLMSESACGRKSLDKFDTNVVRNVQLSRQGNDYSSNMISPKTFPCHRSELANRKGDFGTNMHAFTFGYLSALSENAISRYKVNRSPVNRSMSDGQLMCSMQDNHNKHEEANQSFVIGNLKHAIQDNSNDCAVFEGHKQGIAQESLPSSQFGDHEVHAVSYIPASKDDTLKNVPDGNADEIDDDITQTTATESCKQTAISQNPHTSENVDVINIIPAKRYGSLEHMKQIKMENAIKMKRLKNIKASGAVIGNLAPKAGRFAMSDSTLPEQTGQSRRDDESGYDKNAAQNHDCGSTSFTDVSDKHVSGNNDCEPVCSIPHSVDVHGTASKVTMITVQPTANSSCKPPLISQRPPSDINMDVAHIIPAKKYGGLEHMKKIKMENAIKLRRLKNVQTSSYGQRSLGTSSRSISNIHTSEMQDYDETNERHESPQSGTLTGQKLQTWHTPDKEFSYSEKQVDEKPIEYGSVALFQKIKKDNVDRLRRMKCVHKRVDTWKSTERSCSDLDPDKEKEYGSVAHFRMVQRKNAARNRKMNAITSKLDTWTEPNPGSEYSTLRQNNCTALQDPRKFGSVAHFQKAKQQNARRTSRLKQATSKLNTWQPRSTMAALVATPREMSMSKHFGQRESLTMSVKKATSKIDTGLVKASKSAGGQVTSWSRHVKDVRSPNPNIMKTTAVVSNPKLSNAIRSCIHFNPKQESNETKSSLVSQISDEPAVASRQAQMLSAQNLGNNGIALSDREYECIQHKLRHPDNKIRFPCTEADVDARLKELMRLLRVSIFAQTARTSRCDGSDGDRGFYVSPCDSFLADEAAMELEYEMEQRALIAGNDLVNFVSKPRPTINKRGAPPTKIPRPVFNVLEKIMQSRARVNFF